MGKKKARLVKKVKGNLKRRKKAKRRRRKRNLRKNDLKEKALLMRITSQQLIIMEQKLKVNLRLKKNGKIRLKILKMMMMTRYIN